ncbi:erythromycin esterase family protein [Marinicella rhabdoformis]|uniref:erythromycin esterase family protein n=1 Tax=Marinicella rhabdoformis TaxID=2580566 RepID=UPI0012AED65A|nr:erythromycin esterase family protein [Marinicella rhabdoformis]
MKYQILPFKKTVLLSVFSIFSTAYFSTAFASQNTKKFEAVVDSLVADICDKSIVLLGELPSHGEAIAFQIKAAVVKRLVETCDFNAVYFEAPVYEFFAFRQALTKKQAKPSQLDRAVGGFWSNTTLQPWRKWLFTQAEEHGLFIAGLDDQVSATSDFAKTKMSIWVGRLVEESQSKSCQQAVDRNLNWRYNDDNPYHQGVNEILKDCSNQAYQAIKKQVNPSIDKSQMVANLANYYARSFDRNTAAERDESMYKNFVWQQADLPANSKAVVWTATVHAARKQGELSFKPLGEWLNDSCSDCLSAIGFSAYSGESSMAGMPTKTIAPAATGTLEASAIKSENDIVYLNQVNLKELAVISSRLFGTFKNANWSEMFDGVVVVKQEKAPSVEK